MTGMVISRPPWKRKAVALEVLAIVALAVGGGGGICSPRPLACHITTPYFLCCFGIEGTR